MRLEHWMKHHNHTASWIAGQIDVDVSLVSRWLRRENLPSLTHANRIHRLTGGKGTPINWEDNINQAQNPKPRTTTRDNSMAAKHEFIWKQAQQLHDQDKQMTGQALARLLNEEGFLTSAGGPYAGGRGIYRLIKSTWSWLHNSENNPDEAAKVAHAYVKANGTLPWK